MNSEHTYMHHDGAVMNHTPNTTMHGVVPGPNHEPFDIDGMFPNHEWAQLDFLQGFDENPRELPQPTFNEHPPLHNANHTPPEPLLEPPMAAEQPSKPSPVSPGTNGYRYTCQPCPFSSNIKRDYNRHLRTHKHKKNTRIRGSNSPLEPIESDTTGFHCPVLGCKFGATGKMFTREDNVWRHIRKVHDIKKQL